MSDPVRTLKPGLSVVAERYVPYHLATISNRFSWGASSVFLQLFDVGLNEWRVLSALRNEPGITGSRIAEMIAVNKSVASRSQRSLRDKGLAAETLEDGQRLWWLTERGVEMHDRIFDIALRREAALLGGLSEAQKSQLFDLMELLLDNLKSVERLDAELTSRQ